jgi:hypothetical protein
VWNGFVAFFGLILLGALSIPAWFFPPLWPLIPLVILAWVNQRLLRYDAIGEHADSAEMKHVFRENWATLYLMGFLLALVAYVPLLGFFAPVVFGLGFIHYLLGSLAAYRADTNKSLVVGNGAR